MMLRQGVIMFVESSLPPRPVSMTAMSTFSLAKKSKAIAVVISKNEGLWISKKLSHLLRKAETSSLEIILKPSAVTTFILSRKSTRWGEE